MAVHCWNADSTNDGWLAYGPTSAAAAANAVVPTGTSRQVLPLPHGQQKVYTLPVGSWVTVVCSGGTPVCYLTPGYGV
jgi:hypothetical protein